MSITVLKPGLLTTVQDCGRFGHAALGVGAAGPMDVVALRLANALVGNPPDAAALEITLLGPVLRFDADACIALTGGELSPRVDAAPVPMWRPLRIRAGNVLDCGTMRRGARACLAFAGGIDVEPVLGSRATDVNARIGPFGGRALAASDTLRFSAGAVGAVEAAMQSPADVAATRKAPENEPSRLRKRASVEDSKSDSRFRGNEGTDFFQVFSNWTLDPRPWFDTDSAHPIRLIRDAHFYALDRASQRELVAAEFRVAADSNRVGFRLDGPRLALAAPLELVSEPVATGTLQLPSGGQPIALMVEHPTTGGYPRIGQIAAVDLPSLAQRRPGDTVRFTEIALAEAQSRYLERERELTRLLDAIAARLSA